MVELSRGDLLKAEVEALVNTVNCVGVMGKGIALQFRQAFPANYDAYRRAVQAGKMKLGRVLVVPTGSMLYPRWIINFPTKEHWRQRSRLDAIRAGLDDLVEQIRRLEIRSVAVPPLGCGSGGLDWNVVRPLIEQAFARIPNVEVELFEPQLAPEPESLRVVTKDPGLTRARAAMLALFDAYLQPGFRLTMLEAQKLCYFLQVAGEPLRLSFTKQRYGPYAEAIHHVLQRLEGHYVRGYGDRSRGATMLVLPAAAVKVRAFLEGEPEVRARVERVRSLMEGFETPYGLELLSTVHWVAREDAAARGDWTRAAGGVAAWSRRKRAYFKPEHVKVAWQRLADQGWLDVEASGEAAIP
jgi:O-acetyl-ADP-ribose deacetylase (regulator of RNase III)